MVEWSISLQPQEELAAFARFGNAVASLCVEKKGARACLKNHFRNLQAPLCGIFYPHSVAVARYAALIRIKSPTNWDSQLTKSLFPTRSIPTNDIEMTIAFYEKLGFEIAFRTVNEAADEKVAFLKLGTLVIETYENKAAALKPGAIDHVAIDVKNIEKVHEMITGAGLNTTQDEVHFLPFWENGVRFFTIEGPNKEKVEFSQYL